MPTGIQVVSSKIVKNLDEIVARGRSSRAFLARVAYPMYQARQMKRWMTEGSSEDEQWAPLNKKYAEWKRINFAGYPGNGLKMLIRTGRLAEGVIGRKMTGDVVSPESQAEPSRAAGHFVMITNTQLVVATEVEYAKYVSAKRKLWVFKPDFRKDIKKRLQKWLFRGDLR